MTDRIVTIAGAALGLALIAGPVMAGISVARVPEPATMTLFGLGVAGAFVARKFIRRK
jgi:PEP-CTERM motif-containing protein